MRKTGVVLTRRKDDPDVYDLTGYRTGTVYVTRYPLGSVGFDVRLDSRSGGVSPPIKYMSSSMRAAVSRLLRYVEGRVTYR